MKYPLFLFFFILSAFHSFAQTPQLINILPDMYYGSPYGLTVFNNNLYMAASPTGVAPALYVYDGVSPPNMVLGLWISGVWRKMAQLNNKLYFGAIYSGTGHELYAYDGINPPTLVADINPGNASSYPGLMTEIGGKLYFHAERATFGREFCIYDGVNPPELYDIANGSAGSDPAEFTGYNGKVYFTATTAITGKELYAYDPVGDTTSLVGEVEAGPTSGDVHELLVFGGKLYFFAKTIDYGLELYAYDGTSINRLTDIATGSLYGITTNSGLIIYNDLLYFGAHDGTYQQLYSYDTLSNSASPAYVASFSLGISELEVFDNKLYFCGEKQGFGAELWAFDGVNLWITADLNPGSVSSSPGSFAKFNNKLYFSATAGSPYGNELYFIYPGGTNVTNASLNNDVTLIPNPITSDAVLQLSLSTATSLRLSVTDISGNLVYASHQQKCQAGNNYITLPLNNQPSGIYFYQLIDDKGSMIASGKMEKL